MRLLLILILLTPIPGFAHRSCEDSLKVSRLNQYLARDIYERPIEIVGKKGVKVPAYSRISRGNIEHIFRHQYDASKSGRFGAKAVAYKTSFGFIEVWFFQTGEGRKGFNIHHRDLASLVAEHYNQVAHKWLSSMNEMTLLFADKLNSPVENPEDFYLGAQMWLDQAGGQLIDASRRIKDRGANRDIDEDVTLLLRRMQGFQLTAEKVDGELKITEFHIDSALTSWQRQEGVPLNFNIQNELLEKTLESVAKRLRQFSKPKWPEGLNWISNEDED